MTQEFLQENLPLDLLTLLSTNLHNPSLMFSEISLLEKTTAVLDTLLLLYAANMDSTLPLDGTQLLDWDLPSSEIY